MVATNFLFNFLDMGSVNACILFQERHSFYSSLKIFRLNVRTRLVGASPEMTKDEQAPSKLKKIVPQEIR